MFPPVAADLPHQGLAVGGGALKLLLQPPLQGLRGLQHRSRICARTSASDKKKRLVLGLLAAEASGATRAASDSDTPPPPQPHSHPV